uniref:LRRCT domain-containing protein n=1 Tax=Petromyzon marinus TaxID=7757 RepID=S4RGS2_PETMA
AQTCSPQCSICLPDVTVCHGLSRVAGAAPPHTKTLLLTDGTISDLRVSDFSELSSVTLAAFSRNAVARIDDGAFRNLSDLRSLLLDGNSLVVSSITARTFEGLRSLRDLRLDGNALSAVRAEWFGDLAALDHLHLGGNVIASVTSDAFWPSALSNLTGLNLTGNLLAHVDRNAFRGLARLRWVDLDGNSLSAMPNAFAFSPELRSVRLGRNPWDCDDCGLLQLSGFLRAFL